MTNHSAPTLSHFYIVAILLELSLNGISIQGLREWINNEDAFVQEKSLERNYTL